MGRMLALLMAVAFTGGMITSPVAFAQGSGGQSGAGMGGRTQTMGSAQTAPVGRGQGGVGRGLGPCGGGNVASAQQGATPCPGLATGGQARGGRGQGPMMGTGQGAGQTGDRMGQGMGPGMGPPAQ